MKNPRFSPGLKGTVVDVGKVNEINVSINGNISAQVTQVANNQADFMIDNPTADRAGEVRAKYTGKRYREFPTTSTFYFFMNTEAPPFNKLAVRQAVNWALDFDALNRTQAGFLSRTHGILPQQVPGYEPSPNLYPGPNLQKARQLIAAGGREGRAGDRMGRPDKDPTPQTMAYYTDLLNQHRPKAKLKTIPSDTYFTDRRRPLAAGADGLGELVRRTTRTRRTSSTCCSTRTTSSRPTTTTPPTTRRTGTSPTASTRSRPSRSRRRPRRSGPQLDRYAQQQAYWATYATRKQSTFFSDRMDFQHCKGDDWPLATHDWARFCLK